MYRVFFSFFMLCDEFRATQGSVSMHLDGRCEYCLTVWICMRQGVGVRALAFHGQTD